VTTTSEAAECETTPSMLLKTDKKQQQLGISVNAH